MRRLLLLLALAGCSQLVDLDGLSGGARDSGADGTPASSDAPAGPDTAGGGNACLTTGHGPPLVRAGDFCIDATEVTNQDYLAFLAEREHDTGGQPAACAWNDSFLPDTTALPWPPPPGRGRYPVGSVDWCDAAAFCQWAGKRLCGRVGGGSLAPAQAGDVTASQWASACSHAGERAFPYGAQLDASACLTGLPERADRIAPVGDRPSCQGGYDGIYDLGANLEEWIDACAGGDPGGAGDPCAVAGGALTSAAADLDCRQSHYTERRDDRYYLRGFRCCWP